MAKQKPILSITMLASDRMDTLPRCLESLTPIREAFPCELIIVDTSKNPLVHKLVTEYADKVDSFEWCDDFAKARNACVALAEGEWLMFIDDDEWFAEPEALIEFFVSGEYKNYGYAHHRIKNYYDADFKTYGYGWLTRLTKLWPDTAFHSKVHEYMAPRKGADKQIFATIYHSGYIFNTEDEKQKHFERNVKLLQEMEAEEPDELRWKVQMLQEYSSILDWEAMKVYGQKSLEYLWGNARKVDVFHFSIIHIGYAIALEKCECYEQIKEVYKKSQDVVKNTLAPKAYMELCMALACYKLGEYENTRLHVKAYLDAYKKYTESPETYAMEVLGIFLSDTFTEDSLVKAYSMLLLAELKLGNEDMFYCYYPYLQWDKELVNRYFDIEVEILACLLRRKDIQMLEKVMQDALSAVFIRPGMMKAILDWEQKDKDQFIQLLEWIKIFDIPIWYKEYVNLLTLEESASKEEVLEIAARYINVLPGIFSDLPEITAVLKKYEIKTADLYLFLDFKTWTQRLNARLEELQMEQVENLRKELENSSLVNDVRFYYFMMVYMEQKALIAEQSQLSFDMLTEILAMFSDYTRFTYETLYGDALQQTEVEQWPEKYQAAKWLQIYFAEIGENITSALGCLAKVIAVYPRLADAMKYYLKRIETDVLNG